MAAGFTAVCPFSVHMKNPFCSDAHCGCAVPGVCGSFVSASPGEFLKFLQQIEIGLLYHHICRERVFSRPCHRDLNSVPSVTVVEKTACRKAANFG